MSKIDGQQLRKVLLEVIDEQSKRGSSLQSVPVLRDASDRLGIRNNEEKEQALLTYWYDLFRTGYLSWGYNIPNPNPPFCHLTEQGRRALAHLSRDPANPDGYLAHISKIAKINPVAESYLNEGLHTYTADCYKASAVMIGAASESMALELRDALVGQMAALGKTAPTNLNDWRIKRVLDALKNELDSKKKDFPSPLWDSFQANWPAFTHQIRVSRNDAGHPTSIDPVSQEQVHASLLIFPELAKLVADLKTWVTINYK
jgi:hypothetical protein